MTPTRRQTIVMLSAPLLAGIAVRPALAAENLQFGAKAAHDGLAAGAVLLIDIRSRAEWRETGVAEGAWPISMHEKGFPERLMAARDLAAGRPVALICATGGRSLAVLRALRNAGYDGFAEVSEGMMGNPAHGPGWIKAGLPVVSLDAALAAAPAAVK